MASTITTTVPPTKSKKEKEREKKERDRERKDKAAQHTERLKTVVRKLPPNLPEEIFWQSVQTWVSDETVTWKIYYPGKLRSRLNKENVPSRAYIAFKTEEQLALFSREYDGHLFRDKSGNESQAVVEFAPFQKVPPEKKKGDARSGTIEKDENYISFIESLAASANPEPVSIEALIASIQPVPQPKTTPLLEALKAEKSAAKEKSAMKDKVAIMRNTAHDAARKEDPAKKKGGKSANGSETQTAPASSKKASNNKKAVSGLNTNGVSNSGSGAGGPPTKSGGPSGKPPKAARPQQQASQPSAPIKVLANPSATTTAPAESQPDPPSSTSAAPKRSRPVLGLASRQFEAALSGAGVNAGERKSRREREKEKDRDVEQVPGSGAVKDSSSTSPHAVKTASSSTRPNPPSPKRDRDRERAATKRKNSVSGASAAIPKVPSILQRAPVVVPDGGQNSALLATGDGSAPLMNSTTTPSAVNLEGGSGHRGGRRGRGRGRGAGAPNVTGAGRPG